MVNETSNLSLTQFTEDGFYWNGRKLRLIEAEHEFDERHEIITLKFVVGEENRKVEKWFE